MIIHGIYKLQEILNRSGVEWTLGPLTLAYTLDIVYEPILDIAIYFEDIERLDIELLRNWGIVNIFKCRNTGFSNRAIYVLGVPCISPRDIVESYELNRNYPLIDRILRRLFSKT